MIIIDKGKTTSKTIELTQNMKQKCRNLFNICEWSRTDLDGCYTWSFLDRIELKLEKDDHGYFIKYMDHFSGESNSRIDEDVLNSFLEYNNWPKKYQFEKIANKFYIS